MTDATREAQDRAERLREEIRSFYDHVLPDDLKTRSRRHQVLGKSDYVSWMRLLHVAMLSSPIWGWA